MKTMFLRFLAIALTIAAIGYLSISPAQVPNAYAVDKEDLEKKKEGVNDKAEKKKDKLEDKKAEAKKDLPPPPSLGGCCGS